MKPDWRNIWRKSGVFSSDPEFLGDTSIQDLITLDGFHGIHGFHTVESFSKVVGEFALACKITPSSAVFEFGCGAGAFLKILEDQYQALVGGLDYSTSLIEVAKANIRAPLGLWHQEALETATPTQEVDACFSHSVFHYFPTTEYAKSVLRNMTQVLKSNGSSTLAILDIRDHAQKKEYLEFRSGSQEINATH